MKILFEAANDYLEESDWKTVAVLKFCLLAMGMMLGMAVKPQHKKTVMAVCVPVLRLVVLYMCVVLF